MDKVGENIRETIGRWAEDTQALLNGLTQLLATHDQTLTQAKTLAQRVEDAERRALAAEARALKLNEDLAAVKAQLDELRRERVRSTSPAPPGPMSPIPREATAAQRIRLAPSTGVPAPVYPAASAAPAVPTAVPAPPPPYVPEPDPAPAPGAPLVSPRAATGPRRPHTIRFSAAMLDELGGGPAAKS